PRRTAAGWFPSIFLYSHTPSFWLQACSTSQGVQTFPPRPQAKFESPDEHFPFEQHPAQFAALQLAPSPALASSPVSSPWKNSPPLDEPPEDDELAEEPPGVPVGPLEPP